MYKNKYSMGSPIILAPWIFIVIVAVLAYHTINRIDGMTFKNAGENSQEYISASGLKACLDKLPSTTPLTGDIAKACFQSARGTPQAFDEVVRPRIDELKWLLTIIAAIGAFFAIAQGAAAWFSAQVYTKQAEESLKSISNAQDAIKARYPLFDHVEGMRKDALTALNNVFTSASKAPDSWAGNTEALDWKDNLFRKLGVEARQKLLSVESFTSIDLDPGFAADEHADILRKFSLFYRSKFLYEEGATQGNFGDLERAQAYLILAGRKTTDFTIKNDLGSLYGTIYTSVTKANPNNTSDANGYLLQSESAFKESLVIEPDQQRAYYSLAVIAGKHRKQYKEAIAELQKALDRKPWQREPSSYMRSMMLYNMACYESLLIQETMQGPIAVTLDDAGRVVEFLQKAADLTSVRKDLIVTDFTDSDGDLTGLLHIADTPLHTKLMELRVALEKKTDDVKAAAQKMKTSAEPLNRKQALTEVMGLLGSVLKKRS